MLLLSCAPARVPDPGRTDCNYFWKRKGVHVCIKNMPTGECDMLFRARPDFIRDPACLCDEPGRVTRTVRGPGYLQLSCR